MFIIHTLRALTMVSNTSRGNASLHSCYQDMHSCDTDLHPGAGLYTQWKSRKYVSTEVDRVQITITRPHHTPLWPLRLSFKAVPSGGLARACFCDNCAYVLGVYGRRKGHTVTTSHGGRPQTHTHVRECLCVMTFDGAFSHVGLMSAFWHKAYGR